MEAFLTSASLQGTAWFCDFIGVNKPFTLHPVSIMRARSVEGPSTPPRDYPPTGTATDLLANPLLYKASTPAFFSKISRSAVSDRYGGYGGLRPLRRLRRSHPLRRHNVERPVARDQ
eukprot:4851606-Prymnesium_polylepis.1